MKKTISRVIVSLLVLSLQLVYGQLPKIKLSTPKKPTVVYDRMDLKSIKAKKARVVFVYIVDNPNTFGVDHIKADYKLHLKGKPAAKGSHVHFSIPAESKREFKLPLEINYLDAFTSASALAEAIGRGKKSIPFKMDITFKIEVKPLEFDVPITTRGDLPLPKAKISPKNKLKKLKL